MNQLVNFVLFTSKEEFCWRAVYFLESLINYWRPFLMKGRGFNYIESTKMKPSVSKANCLWGTNGLPLLWLLIFKL